ncbi:MAG: NAD(+)/NADH kinase [Planctomycetota bacterium]
MSDTEKTTRAYLIGNPNKPEAAAALADLEAFAGSRCEVVGSELRLDGRAAVEAEADRIVVIGGDGTLIGVARSLGTDQIPLIGVNVGKLGFLAEFSLDELKRTFTQAMCDDAVVSRRMMLDVTVQENGGGSITHPAINDCVIQAGPPYRMVTLGVSINQHHLTEVGGDGLIICTPSGSTAHNMSAGGPIMQCGVDAIVLTPMSPHSLTHRPLVIERDAVIDILAGSVNEGTTAIIDGQVSCPLRPGDRVTVRRFEKDCLLVHNPLFTGWHKLVHKLHWGQAPNYD